MMYYLYDLETGLLGACTKSPEEYPHRGYTDQEPPEHDEWTQQAYFVDGAWEIRQI